MIAVILEGEQNRIWRARARCNEGAGALTPLFFSEQLDDIAAAKRICGECEVRSACLTGALARGEPWGVWGGELIWRGRVLTQKRRRGRPPLPRDPVTGQIVRPSGSELDADADAEVEVARIA